MIPTYNKKIDIVVNAADKVMGCVRRMRPISVNDGSLTRCCDGISKG